MQWESMGFKDEPFKTQPLTAYTLDLYVGNQDKIASCQFALQTNNIVMVIEGARGVGTTSFGNFLRFKAQKESKYFTPTSEIRVEPTWNAETLITAVMANIVSTLELHYHEKIKSNKKFNDAKAMVQRVTKTFRSFGASAFGVGGTYGQSTNVVHPVIVPTQVLSHHLEDLVQIIFELGFKYGVLIQLNNLDVGVVQNEEHLKMLFNIMRDYFQITGTSWLLVGDLSLRRFIAQNVDRVDDIVAYETVVTALAQDEYLKMIQKRVEYYRVDQKVTLPVDEEVWLYLYSITYGRLRYIFGLINRLFNVLQLGTLSDRITLELAKPVIIDYARERIHRFNLSANEELVLKAIVEKKNITVKELANYLGKKSNYLSNILAQLQGYRLIEYTKEWRNRFYHASIDAAIAYSNE